MRQVNRPISADLEEPQLSWLRPAPFPERPKKQGSPGSQTAQDSKAKPRGQCARPSSQEQQCEDEMILMCVHRLGVSNWARIAQEVNSQVCTTRTAKQFRERYNNYLRPTISTRPWDQAEDRLLLTLHFELGSSWTKIAKSLPDRSQNLLKNRFFSIARKSFRRMLKLLGCKDGTRIVRDAKPTTLSLMLENTTLKYSTETVEALTDCVLRYSSPKYKSLVTQFSDEERGRVRRLIQLAEQSIIDLPRKQGPRDKQEESETGSLRQLDEWHEEGDFFVPFEGEDIRCSPLDYCD